MMSGSSKPILAILLLITVAGSAYSQELTSYRTVVYSNLPIPFTLRAGKEKIVSFSEDVQWSIPRELTGIVSGEAVAGTVYLTSSSEFETTRFHFRAIDSNQHYIFDITSSDTGETTPLRVLTQSRVSDTELDTRSHTAASPSSRTPSTGRKMGMAEVIRAVYQDIYAPERLLESSANLSSKTFDNPPTYTRLLPGHDVLAIPFSQWWTTDGMYATALHITNNEPYLIRIDPRKIRSSPDWIAFSSISKELLPANQYGDKIVAVVITRQSFVDISDWMK